MTRTITYCVCGRELLDTMLCEGCGRCVLCCGCYDLDEQDYYELLEECYSNWLSKRMSYDIDKIWMEHFEIMLRLAEEYEGE
jgi:coenzyme F420-reducing hydrogenase beta subunit